MINNDNVNARMNLAMQYK